MCSNPAVNTDLAHETTQGQFFMLDPSFMFTKLRQAFLLPSLTQWRNWTLPSKQTAAGYFVGVASLVLGIYALFPSTEAERDTTRKTIESIVAIRTAEAKAIAEIDHNFHPSADFTSQEKVLAEWERFNEYSRKTSEAFDLAAVHRLFKQYGTKQQQADLSSRINRVHDTSLAVSNFLVSLANSHGPASQADLNQLVAQYVSLLNDVKASQSSLHGFVTGLTGKYFGY